MVGIAYAFIKTMKAKLAYVVALITAVSFSVFGGTEQIQQASVQLNDTVAKADTKALVPVAARLLKVDKATAEKVLMVENLTVADLACAALLSEKTSKPIQEILTENPDRNWAQAFETSKLKVEEAVQYLDTMNTEFAFAALDLPRKKKK